MTQQVLEDAHDAVSAELRHVTELLARAREIEKASPDDSDAAKRADQIARRLGRVVRMLSMAQAARSREASLVEAQAREAEREAKRRAARVFKLAKSRKPEERAEFALELLRELPASLAVAVAREIVGARASEAEAEASDG